jgi:hypothetical protein
LEIILTEAFARNPIHSPMKDAVSPRP